MDIPEEKNMRKGPDFVAKIATPFNVLTWFILIVSLSIYYMADPEIGSFYLPMRYVIIDQDTATFFIPLLLLLNIVIALCGIVANATRNKRKTDRFRTSLVVSSLLSIWGFIFIITSV